MKMGKYVRCNTVMKGMVQVELLELITMYQLQISFLSPERWTFETTLTIVSLEGEISQKTLRKGISLVEGMFDINFRDFNRDCLFFDK